MKNTYLYILLLLLISFYNCSDDDGSNVFNGDVELVSQEDVNDFGSANYTTINGNLSINSTDVPEFAITDLTPLMNLRAISERLEILGSNFLVNLDGLNNLNASQIVVISRNEALENIDALNDIENVEGGIAIFANSSLLEINGFNNLNTSSVGIVNITGNFSLVRVNGFNSITNISPFSTDDGIIQTFGDVRISNNPNLESINMLNNLISVESVFEITENDALQSLSNAFNNLEEIGFALRITRNDILENIDGFSNLQRIFRETDSGDNELTITENPLLTNLCGIESLFTNDELPEDILILANGFDPDIQDFIDGNCSL